jgi:hypothetical protein
LEHPKAIKAFKNGKMIDWRARLGRTLMSCLDDPNFHAIARQTQRGDKAGRPTTDNDHVIHSDYPILCKA